MSLSYSQLSTYRRCPRQYEYGSVKKIPRALSEGESFGSSIHNTLRKFGLLELEQMQPNEKKQLKLFTEDHAHDQKTDLSLTTLLSLWRESFIAEGYPSGEAMTERLKEGEAALEKYFEWWQREKREVVAIEKGFSFRIEGADNLVLAGRFDRVERTAAGLKIIDYKSTKPRDSAQLQSDLQLSVYAIAAADLWQEAVGSLAILSIQKDGVTEQCTERSEADLINAQKEIRGLHKRMTALDYKATPSVTVCQHCPYREICTERIG